MAPVLFVSHGAPTIVSEPSAARDFLSTAEAGLAGVRAIVVASAHWETDQPLVGGASAPETIHDFGRGFGPDLFAMRYPAPGDPAVAAQVVAELRAAGLAADIDPDRGLDHGVWTPLRLMRPDADLPVVPVSIQPADGVEGALRLGRALAQLPARGVAVLASGALTHNLSELDWSGRGPPTPYAVDFADWFADRIAARDLDALRDYRRRAPDAARNHPTDEHLLPLYVAIGAAGLEGAERLHASYTYGALAMDVYRFAGTEPSRALS